MATTSVDIRMDSELMKRAQVVFDALGLDMSTAIDMLLRKAIYQQDVTLQPTASMTVMSKKKDRRAAFGCLRDKIRVPDDFNEPLEDFKEYM